MGTAEAVEIVKQTIEEGALPEPPYIPWRIYCESCGHELSLHGHQTYFAENQKSFTTFCRYDGCPCEKTEINAYKS